MQRESFVVICGAVAIPTAPATRRVLPARFGLEDGPLAHLGRYLETHETHSDSLTPCAAVGMRFSAGSVSEAVTLGRPGWVGRRFRAVFVAGIRRPATWPHGAGEWGSVRDEFVRDTHGHRVFFNRSVREISAPGSALSRHPTRMTCEPLRVRQ
jgi:hypothetical protein